MKLYYDLHMHSCLSPCADDDMTPMNMAGMGMLKGLSVMALTDHNSCRNCPAFFKACENYGIVPIAGMELSTAEDVHMVVLFPTLEAAIAFEEALEAHRMGMDNAPKIFGNQFVMNEKDEVAYEFAPLLIAATDLWMGDAVEMVRAHGGVIYPAHIDREANGIIAMLGDIPPEYAFSAMEYRDRTKREQYENLYAEAFGKSVLVSSDAHALYNISEAENCFPFEVEEGTSASEIRAKVFEYIQNT